MRYLLAVLISLTLAAGTVDRLIITVGTTAITELQLDEDIRVAALFNGQQVSRDTDARRTAADRLIDQYLIRHEMDLSRYPSPSPEEIADYYTRTEQTLGGTAHLKELLDKYNVSEATLRAHLASQLATLRFVNFRFNPDVDITDAELAAFAARSAVPMTTPLPSDQRARMAQLIIEERTDQALNTWLSESRKQVNIRYVDTSLR